MQSVGAGDRTTNLAVKGRPLYLLSYSLLFFFRVTILVTDFALSFIFAITTTVLAYTLKG